MSVKKIYDNITPSLTRQIRQSKDIPSKAHKRWVEITPIDTGGAKRRTRLRGKTIHANYPYATELEKGSSRQARNGMSKPVTEYITQLLKKILRK